MAKNRLCYAEECLLPAVKRGLCEAHYRRSRRGSAKKGPVRQSGEDAFAVLVEGSRAFWEVDSEDDRAFKAAKVRLARSAHIYVRRVNANRSTEDA